MTILHTLPLRITLASWAPFIGGAEVAVERLALGLTAAGHDVLLVVGTDGDALAKFRDAGIRCEFVQQKFTDKLNWLQYRRSRKRLQEVLSREQPDIVHSNDLPTHQMVSDAARRLNIPCICHHRWVFDGPAIDWMNKYGAARHLFVSAYLMNTLCKASASLTTSQRAVVYDGLELPSMPSANDKLRARERLGLPLDRTVVLYAGQIIERKGVADLLRGWSLMSPEIRERATLVIVGDDLENQGRYRGQMENLAAELALPVRFPGFQKSVRDWLVAADIATVPSHLEPLGNATLEAMSHGLPVVGTQIGGIPEMVSHDETGLLISAHAPELLATAVASLIENPEKRHRFGIAARKCCEERFGLGRHTNSVVECYHAVLQRSLGVLNG